MGKKLKHYPMHVSREAQYAMEEKEHAGKMVEWKPEKFLKRARKLTMGKHDKKVIKRFKKAMKKGAHFNPLRLYRDNEQDGRHRAVAAEELGIKKVPVIDYRDTKKRKGKAGGGEVVAAALKAAKSLMPAAQDTQQGLKTFMKGAEPERWFHGTNKDFSTFQASRAPRNEQMGLTGVHLSKEPSFANNYAQGDGANIMPVYASGNFLDAQGLVQHGSKEHDVLNDLVKRTGRKPFWSDDGNGNLTAPPLASYIDAVSPQKAEKVIKSHGFDGVQYDAKYGSLAPGGNGAYISDRSPALVVFDPSNIKSATGNSGAYDTSIPDITKSWGGRVGFGDGGTATDDSDIQQYLDTARQVQAQSPDIQSMTHLPDKPRRNVDINAPLFGGKVNLGSANYDVADPIKTSLQTAYDLKTAPLYFTPAAPLAAAADVTEGAAAGDPLQMGLAGAGAPGKVAKALTAAAAALYPGGAEAGASDITRQALKFAKPNELGLYSHAAEAAANLPQSKGTVEQMLGILQNKFGVKPDELKWSNFDKAFPDPQAKVTSQQLAEHFAGNQPAVEEKTLYGKGYKAPGLTPEEHREVDQLISLGPQMTPEQRARYRDLSGRDVDNITKTDFTPAKFEQYAIPGGENYREVLLKAPLQTSDATKQGLDLTRRMNDGEFNSLNDSDRRALFAQRDSLLQQGREEEGGLYRSSHWDDPNVLAHLRMSDRTGENGEKLLHLEELQSDWGQKGRQTGFRGPDITQDQRDAVNNIFSKAGYSHLNANNWGSGWDPIKLAEEKLLPEGKISPEDVNTLKSFRQSLVSRNGPPEAPYVTSTQGWTDLGLKRALTEAANGGHDRLIWTPGHEQAARYDLANKISRVRWSPDTQTVMAHGLDGEQVLNQTAKAEDLPNIIGKEAADKLLKSDPHTIGSSNVQYHTLEGNDLKLEHAGMKGYYDKMLPTQLQKIVKKLDPEAKIEPYQLHDPRIPENVDIPPGTPWPRKPWEDPNFQNLPPEQRAAEMEKLYAETRQKLRTMTVPSIKITPLMRERIKQGLPAFAQGGEVS